MSFPSSVSKISPPTFLESLRISAFLYLNFKYLNFYRKIHRRRFFFLLLYNSLNMCLGSFGYTWRLFKRYLDFHRKSFTTEDFDLLKKLCCLQFSYICPLFDLTIRILTRSAIYQIHCCFFYPPFRNDFVGRSMTTGC